MLEAFETFNFRPATLERIERANAIIEEYQAQGFTLTLRQLYYQFVARGLIANTQRSYDNLGKTINDARLAGLVDWAAIEDRTRNLASNNHWTSGGEIIEACANQFQLDKWEDQDHAVEVWIEKEALAGVIEGVCRRNDVAYFACRGYVSQSEQYKAGKRFGRYARQGRRPIVIHLGDHDPSGIDMTRDNSERLIMFARYGVKVDRIALNWDQIEEYNPPPNPAKVTDSRYESYADKYGDESWELDALEPRILDALVDETIAKYRDNDRFEALAARELEIRDQIRHVADTFEE